MVRIGQPDGVGDLLGVEILVVFLMVELVDEAADVHGLAVGEHVEIAALSGRAEENVDHGLDQVDVLVGPAGEHGDVGERIAVDGGVKRTRHRAAAVLVDHLGEFQAQRAQVFFRSALPAGADLVGVHVHGEPDHAGGGQFAHQFRGQRLAVGIDDGLPALGRDVTHQGHDVGVNERLAAGNGDAVGATHLFDLLQIADDVGQRLVAEGIVLAVAAFAVQVALGSRLKPGDGVVGQVPGHPVVQMRRQRAFSHGGCIHWAEDLPLWRRLGVCVTANGRCWQPRRPGMACFHGPPGLSACRPGRGKRQGKS